MAQFSAYLNDVVPMLLKIIKTSQSMAEARNKFVERYEGLFRCFLYDYEEKCMS